MKESLEVRIPRAQRTWGRMNTDPEFIALRDRVLHLVRGGGNGA
jgi:hypothetical protein